MKIGEGVFDKFLNDATAEFDALAASKRLDKVCDTLGLRRLSNRHPIRQMVDSSIRYRNECVHDAPILTLAPRTHRRSASARGGDRPAHRDLGDYEQLALSTQPVRFKHVVGSAKAHDGVVEYLYEAMSGSEWLRELRALDVCLGVGTLASAMPASLEWAKVEQIAEHWESLRAKLDSAVSQNEMRQIGLNLRREVRVRRASDSESM